MPCHSRRRYIRLEFISGQNLKVPSWRTPAGICVSINFDSWRRWKSSVKVPSFEESVVWGDTVTLSSHASSAFSLEIRASYELGRRLGSGEIIGKLQISWDNLLDYGDEAFKLYFPPVWGIYPSLTLKTTVVNACDNQNGVLSGSLVERKIARDTDAGHAHVAKYETNNTVSQLKYAMQRFQLVLDQCWVGHLDRATALTNLAWARLIGYIDNHVQDIDTTISLFRDAFALRPQCHPDHALSLHNLTNALTWRHRRKGTASDIREITQLYHELLRPEGTYRHSIAAGENGVDCVIRRCNDLPIDASDEGIHLRRVVLELCPLGHQLRPRALDKLSWALSSRFEQHGNIDDIDMSIQLGREAMSLCPEGHGGRYYYLNNLAVLLKFRFNHHGKPDDLDEAISLYEEALCLRPVGHERRDTLLHNLGSILITRFEEHGDIDDITQAVSILREALTLRPPEHPYRDVTLHSLAFALQHRYDQSDVSGDINEAIDWYRESLRLMRLDDPERHATLHNLSSALCSRFTHTQENEDVEEAITLCQESLTALSLLHPSRYFSYMRLQEAYPSRYRILHEPTDL